jgi:hypothetical protein
MIDRQKRALLYKATALIGGAALGTSVQGRENLERSIISRIVLENPTQKPQLLTLTVTNEPIPALRVQSQSGTSQTIRNYAQNGMLPLMLQATKIKPTIKPIFDQTFTVDVNSELMVLLQHMPEGGEILYRLKPQSKQSTPSINTWGTIGCSTQFDALVSPNETRSTCGSRLQELSEYQSASKRRIDLRHTRTSSNH